MVARTLSSLGRNLRASLRCPRLLVARLSHQRPFWDLLRWLRAHDPRLLAQIDPRCAGDAVWRMEGRCALLNWLQDPVRDVDPAAAAWMEVLEARAARRGVRVVHPVAVQGRSRKSVQSRLLRDAGFDTPPVGAPGEVGFPVVVRSDVAHSGRLRRFEDAAALARADLGVFRDPVASPFVDTRDADGYYRKYRYFLAGSNGAPRHLQISRDWCVRMDQRELGAAQIEEELAYVDAPDPRHDLLDRARRVLGFELVAFDYSLRPDGSVVLWEANPLPMLWTHEMDGPRFAYQRPAMERLYRVFQSWLQGLLDER